jgi:hypothetical protein
MMAKFALYMTKVIDVLGIASLDLLTLISIGKKK